MKNSQSVYEGTESEKLFRKLRGDNFVRRATREEDMNEHWDVLDSEFGRVDVKAAKRKFRGGPVDYTIWWELKTVKRPPNWRSKSGWGVPNEVDRLIAVRSEDAFYLVNPNDIIEILREKCTEYYRGDFGLHSRPDRGDLMTILPLSFIVENSVGRVSI